MTETEIKKRQRLNFEITLAVSLKSVAKYSIAGELGGVLSSFSEVQETRFMTKMPEHVDVFFQLSHQCRIQNIQWCALLTLRSK